MLWHGPKHTLPLSRLLVRLSQKAFFCQETQTLTVHPEKPTSSFLSPVRKEKEQFARGQRSRLASGTIPVLSWKSHERINGSIFSNGLLPRGRPDQCSRR